MPPLSLPLVAALLLLSLTACGSPEPKPRQTSRAERPVSRERTPDKEAAPASLLASKTPSPPPGFGPATGQQNPFEAPAATPSPTQAAPVAASATAAPATFQLQEAEPRSTLALALPGPAKPAGSGDAGLKSLIAQAQSSRMAADWRKAGERALKLEMYGQAADAFRREAGIYRSKGILQAALAQEARAAQYSTELSLYLSVAAPKPRKLERLEPVSGCYVGAFIDRDANLDQFMAASQTHGDVDDFNRLTGKKHASFFMYRTYGQPFPKKWAEYLKQRGAIVHIAWEPKNLKDVRNDRYLQEFVDEIVALDHPVMLRFASEMNGEWTPYHGDPEAYKKAFRLVYKATRRAPKAAMMWCPNTIPRQTIEAYYPGDDAVDWVGVNFYSVPFLDNDRGRPGERIHPTDHLQAVYDLYAARKPIAIGEWAASRQSAAIPQPLTEFAKTKISQLYGTLPTRYPRVKMVNWYDSNNLKNAQPNRQLNNYQVTSPPDLVDHYSKAVEPPYFLGAEDQDSPPAFRPLFGKARADSSSTLRISLKTYEQRPKVYFRVNGALLLASDDPLDWRVPGSHWKPGKNAVDVFVFDRKNRFVSKASAVVLGPEA